MCGSKNFPFGIFTFEFLSKAKTPRFISRSCFLIICGSIFELIRFNFVCKVAKSLSTVCRHDMKIHITEHIVKSEVRLRLKKNNDDGNFWHVIIPRILFDLFTFRANLCKQKW